MSPSTSSRATVIGAGLVGLATAWELTRAGRSVTIIDPDPLSGASHHAAGMLAPTAEMVYGQESLLPLMRTSMRLYPQLIASVVEATDVPTGFRSEGTYVVAGDNADRTHITELADFQRRCGQQVHQLSPRALRKAEPAVAPTVAAAISIPGDHQIDPRRFGAALIDALKRRGATFEARHATRDDLDSETIVCCGLGASELVDGLHLRPVWGDIVRLRVPDRYFPLVSSVIRGFVHDRPIYLVPRADGGLVLGATSREDDLGAPKVGGVLDLLRDAAFIVPGVQECEVVEVTAGARPGTPDDLPYVGRDRDSSALISTGYFRHGILLTALAAKLGSRLLMTSEQQVIDEFVDWPFDYGDDPVARESGVDGVGTGSGSGVGIGSGAGVGTGAAEASSDGAESSNSDQAPGFVVAPGLDDIEAMLRSMDPYRFS